MSDVVRIKIVVGTGFTGCTHKDTVEIDREEWEDMSQEEQNALLDEVAVDFRNNVIDTNAWVMEDDE